MTMSPESVANAGATASASHRNAARSTLTTGLPVMTLWLLQDIALNSPSSIAGNPTKRSPVTM